MHSYLAFQLRASEFRGLRRIFSSSFTFFILNCYINYYYHPAPQPWFMAIPSLLMMKERKAVNRCWETEKNNFLRTRAYQIPSPTPSWVGGRQRWNRRTDDHVWLEGRAERQTSYQRDWARQRKSSARDSGWGSCRAYFRQTVRAACHVTGGVIVSNKLTLCFLSRANQCKTQAGQLCIWNVIICILKEWF